jgi:hypothetical protein
MDKTDEFLKQLLDKSREASTTIKNGDKSSSEKQCPDEETLACYLDNLLSGTEKENVEEHFIECDKCLQLVIFLHKLKNEIKEEGLIKTPQEVIKKAKDLVLERPLKDLVEVVLSFGKDTINVLKDTGAMFTPLEKIPVKVRNSQNEKEKGLVYLRKTFNNLQVEIKIERLNENNFFDIEALTLDSKKGVPIDDVRLNLIFNKREITSYLTANGSASFKNLCFGKYALVIIREKNVIGKIKLQLETA